MREFRTLGSVRGAGGDLGPYRNRPVSPAGLYPLLRRISTYLMRWA